MGNKVILWKNPGPQFLLLGGNRSIPCKTQNSHIQKNR